MWGLSARLNIYACRKHYKFGGRYLLVHEHYSRALFNFSQLICFFKLSPTDGKHINLTITTLPRMCIVFHCNADNDTRMNAFLALLFLSVYCNKPSLGGDRKTSAH